MTTISLDLHHRPWGQASPVAPTAILRALQVLSAITAHHAQVLVAVHVNATVSLAGAIGSNSIVAVRAVATVMTRVPVVLPVKRKNTYLEALEDMAWL